MLAADDLYERVRSALGARYDVHRQIGSGGSSIVFAATDRRDGQPVALKILKPEFAASTTAERFQREIRLSGTMHHPSIVPIRDAGVAGDLMYLAMPLI